MFARRTTVRGPHDLRTRARVCSFERLESREMLSGSGWAAMTAKPLLSPAYSGGQNGYTPAEIARAYGVDQLPAFANGAAANGAGQTIAVIDAFDDPTIASDLQTFDQAFHLPAPPTLRKWTSRAARTTRTGPRMVGGNGLGRRVGPCDRSRGKHSPRRDGIRSVDRPARGRRLRPASARGLGRLHELGFVRVFSRDDPGQLSSPRPRESGVTFLAATGDGGRRRTGRPFRRTSWRSAARRATDVRRDRDVSI